MRTQQMTDQKINNVKVHPVNIRSNPNYNFAPSYSQAVSNNYYNTSVGNGPPNLSSMLEDFKKQIITNLNIQMCTLNDKIEEQNSKISYLFEMIDIRHV